MNLSVVARMFGGNIACVMGHNIANDEHKMPTGIVK